MANATASLTKSFTTALWATLFGTIVALFLGLLLTPINAILPPLVWLIWAFLLIWFGAMSIKGKQGMGKTFMDWIVSILLIAFIGGILSMIPMISGWFTWINLATIPGLIGVIVYATVGLGIANWVMKKMKM